jgi:hypothetical protein
MKTFLSNSLNQIIKVILIFKKYLVKSFSIHFTNWVMVLSAIGSLAVATGTFATIHYINEQNKLTIKPQVLIGDEYMLFRIKGFPDNEGPTYFLTSNISKDSSDLNYPKQINPIPIVPFYHRNNFQFHLVNVGLGVAKNLSLTWSYDTIGYREILNHFKPLTKNSYYYHILKELVRSTWDTSDHNLDAILPDNDNFLFLLPYSSSKEKLSCELPNYFLLLCSVNELIGNQIFLENKFHYKPGKTPEVFLTITYSDITNNPFKEKYRISLINYDYLNDKNKDELYMIKNVVFKNTK